jgi:hypothetical protein
VVGYVSQLEIHILILEFGRVGVLKRALPCLHSVPLFRRDDHESRAAKGPPSLRLLVWLVSMLWSGCSLQPLQKQLILL